MVHKLIQFLSRPPMDGPRAAVLIRLMAGSVFFWEGVLKFVYVNQGIGRFTKLGMPVPDILAPAIAYLEIGVWVGHALDCRAFHHRDDRRHPVYQGQPLPGHVASSITPCTAQGWLVGRAARDAFGLGADSNLRIPSVGRAGPMVHRRHPETEGGGAR
jgi:hypothetical protein